MLILFCNVATTTTQTLLNKLGNVHLLNTSDPFVLFLFLDFELLNSLKKTT